MKYNKTRLGLSILAGGLSFVGSASAVDLIVNGSFENPNAGEWKYFATYNHSTSYFAGSPIPAEENPGANFSWRHASAQGDWSNFVTPTNEVDHLQYNLRWADAQTVNLTNAIAGAAIDSGLGQYSFSSWLASYGNPSSNPEQPYLVLRFFDDTGTNQVGADVIFDRTTNKHAVMFADGNTSVPDDVSTDHNWIKYADTGAVPKGARKATVYITRSPNAELSGTPDTYVDLVKLDVLNVNDTTVLDGLYPTDGMANVPPDGAIKITLKDINTQVNQSSIQLFYDGGQVLPNVGKSGAITTIQYDPPGLLAPFVTHTYKVIWKDNGSPATSKTNQASFTVSPYVNIQLGQPLYLETFDELAEGALPAGWTTNNFTDQNLPWYDLNDFHSDAYLNWVVISRSTLSNLWNVTPGGADFIRVTNVAPNQVINGQLVTNLIDGNFIFAVSDRADNEKQIQYLYSRDYDLSGKTNVYAVFNSLWVQNQDSMASFEYSTDGGATWLPGLYLLDGPDILRDSNGNIDASNTFAALKTDVPDLAGGTLGNGNYGQFIGVASGKWSGLSPYLSARIDDDQTDSKRVEVIRLADADQKATVRFRFANIGTYSWYWGIDNFGLYSLSQVDPPIVAAGPAPSAQTVAAGNSASISIAAPMGLGPFTYQWRHNGTSLPGKTSQNLVFGVVKPSDDGVYDVVVSNAGGSTTSAVPAAVLTVINPPVHVTGQWDFNGDLKATIGRDLEYFDTTVQADTTFGTTTSFGIADINGQSATVMRYVPSTANWGGYKAYHGAAPNGGGAYVNQYTLVYDLYLPTDTWRSLWQTATGNPADNDGDLFINPSGGVGISSVYNGQITSGSWHRVAVAFDLTGPGQSPVLTKFVDGVKVGNQTTGLSGRDGRFSLDPYALLFADNDGDLAETYVSSVQFSDGRWPDAYLVALGGPSASKIPGSIQVQVLAGQIVIRWSGGVPLESAPAVTGPWATVAGATSPYTVANPTEARFFRPKLF